MKETIIWTALPNGRSEQGKLLMSAHVTFHLSYTAQELAQAGGKAKVSNFPTVAGFKPESIAIKVFFNGKPFDAKIISKPESGLWSKFFPAEGPVTSYDPVKPEWQEVRTFATFDIYKQMESVHADFVIASFEPSLKFGDQKLNPSLNLMAPNADLVKNRVLRTKDVRSTAKDPHAPIRATMDADFAHPQFKSILESRRVGQAVVGQKVSDLMVEAVHFHRPFVPATGVWALPTRPETDFHDAHAMLCQHPQLMRLVGVVFDLEIATLPPGDGVLSIQVEGMPAASTKFPGTMCSVTSTGFLAKERTSVKGTTGYSSDIVQGFMRMNPEDVALGAMDLSGAVLQTAGFLDHLEQQKANLLAISTVAVKIGAGGATGRPPKIGAANPSSEDKQDRGPQKVAAQSEDRDAAQMPARRTSGITLYRREHSARHLVRDTIGQQIYSARFADTLYADDLHKGWRPDVLHKGKWFSLTARSLFYRIADKALPTDLSDEGHVSPSNSSSPDGKVVKIPESVLTWDGWSLSAPKPVSPLVDRSLQDDSMPNTSTISSIAEARSHKYQPTETDKFYRLNYFAEPAKGSLPTLRYGEVYAIRSRSVDLAGNSLPLGAKEPSGASQTITYLRHEPILPPSVHLHDSAGPGESAYLLAVRKSADGKIGSKSLRFLYPPVGGMNMAELHGKFDLPTGSPDPTFWDKVAAVDARKELPDIITSVNAPPVPYLIDPACTGAAVKREGRASKPTDIATTSFLPVGVWIDAQPSSLSLMPGTSFQMTSSTGVQGIGLTLAPGQDVTVSLSSTTSEDYLPVFEQTRWIEKSLQSKGDSLVRAAKSPKFSQRIERHRTHRPFSFEPVSLRPIAIRFTLEATAESSSQKALEACLKGQNSAISPTRSVRVVYATQVPENGFKFDKIDVTREGTAAMFDMRGQVHGWSTEELEFTINYSDPVDDIDEHRRKTETESHDAKIADLNPAYIDTVPVNGWYADEGIEFHDTKCHIVEITAVAKTRYADFFPNAQKATPTLKNIGRRPPKMVVTAASTESEGPAGPYSRTYIKTNVIVPSSKRPDKPQVEYMLPAMTWSSDSTASGKVSRKRGNTIRIYLRRPWFSSGIGEKLAIVLPDGSGPNANNPDYYYHSTIGFDPAFEFLDNPLKMTPGHFLGKSGVATDVKISEIGGTATLITYDPKFDSQLQLWYVDVEIDPLNPYYTPFLRLVVCRYQPNSTEGNHVSPLSVTEITQLQPDRVALVVTVEPRKTYNVFYAGIQGKTKIAPNVVIGTLETQANSNADAPWMPVMKDNEPFEFFVPFSNGPLGMFALLSNLYDWSANPENLAKLAQGRPGTVTVPNSASEYRVVLREFEVHPSQEGDPPVSINNSSIAGRLVHADVINLTLGSPPARGPGNIKP